MTTLRIRVMAAAALVAMMAAPPARAGEDRAAEAAQVVYELNRARWNPALFSLETGLGLPAIPAAPPVAPDPRLARSAMSKADEMAQYRYFTHQSPITGIWPNELVRGTGFPLPGSWPDDANYLESIHSGSTDPRRVVMSFAASPSHRSHLFGLDGFSAYTEIGVGRSSTLAYWAVHLTQRATPLLTVTGVAFADVNGNGRMDLGEGLAGVPVTMGTATTTTGPGGGYSLPLPPSAATISAVVDGFVITGSIVPGSYSIGVDFVAGDPRAVVRAYETCAGLAPTILGTDRRDVIAGTPGDDVIHGLGGNDTIDGMGGNDVICGGSGSDRLDGGDGDDLLIGGRGTDRLRGGAGRDSLQAGAGDDTLRGGDGDDTLLGGSGTDDADGGSGSNTCASTETAVRCGP